VKKCIYDPFYRQLVQELRKARRGKHLRQEDVARELGTTRTWVSKIEHCDVRMDVLQFMAMASLYGLDCGELLRSLVPDGASREGTRSSAAG
jgi:transcriptional regulator with XRE-family HTH domain